MKMTKEQLQKEYEIICTLNEALCEEVKDLREINGKLELEILSLQKEIENLQVNYANKN